ncbi:MAG: hypothetical protein RL609_1668 [Bacteroidota bacterium]|jgi:tetratricopeptide (TPR) repeat protein
MPVSGIGKDISKLEWTAWLNTPSLLKTEHIPALEKLISEYPWFAQAHALLALAKKNSGASDFQTQLQQAALRAPNRRFIYQLLEKTIPEAIPEIEVEAEIPKEVAPTAPIPDHWVDVILEDDPLPVITVDDDWVDIRLDQPREENENENENENGNESGKEERAPLPESVELSELGELGQDIMNKAISSSIELEVSEKETTEVVVAPSVQQYDDDFLNFIAHSIGELADPINLNEGWSEPKIQPEDNTPAPVHNLIEKFIQNEPQINRGKAVEYAAGNMAKESLEEDVNLVTETMAKLYVKQGKLDKARKAYKKLIELYPEKSVYFAGQLKNLNKKN